MAWAIGSGSGGGRGTMGLSEKPPMAVVIGSGLGGGRGTMGSRKKPGREFKLSTGSRAQVKLSGA